MDNDRRKKKNVRFEKIKIKLVGVETHHFGEDPDDDSKKCGKP